MKNISVVKFGGTCLADSEGRVKTTDHCLKLLEESDKLVVVVSAMGRKGDPYATDTLSDLATEALPAEKDLLLSCGEIISAVVVSTMIRAKGISVRAMSGWEAGIHTDGIESDSCITSINPQNVTNALKGVSCVVVAGFQGVSKAGRITTLGRGGSDTTAVALAAALGAEEVIFYKTVDGVYTADPEIVSQAAKLSRISAEDLRQLAWQGAKVVHPRAAETALKTGVSIDVRSQDTNRTVTKIESSVIKSGNYITGVAGGPEVTQFRVAGDETRSPSAFFSEVFSLVADAGVSMDMFSVFDRSALFTVPVEKTGQVEFILKKSGINYSTRTPCAKISIVGAGMHGLRGVMARFASALDSTGINMLQTVDSHATISALVQVKDCEKALQVLHKEFIEKTE